MPTKKTQPGEQTSSIATSASFVEDRAVAGLLAGKEQPETSKVGGRYKVNGVWVNANGERLADQRDEPEEESSQNED